METIARIGIKSRVESTFGLLSFDACCPIKRNLNIHFLFSTRVSSTRDPWNPFVAIKLAGMFVKHEV